MVRERAKWLVAALLAAACTFDSAGLGISATLGDTGDDLPGPTDSTSSPSTTHAASSEGDPTSGSEPDSTSVASTTTSSQASTGMLDDSTSTGHDSSASTTGGAVEPWCDPSWADLAACYGFQDLAAGVLVDESATGNHGTVDGITIEAGPLGEAAAFSDASVVSVPAHPITDLVSPVTVELWLRVDDLPAQDRVGVLDRDGQYSLFIYAGTGLRCGAHTFAYWQPATLGSWMHVGCVMDTDMVRLYVDGLLVDEVAWDGGIPTGNSNPMSIGDESPGFTQPLGGAIGGVRLWSVARTQAELCEAAGELCS